MISVIVVGAIGILFNVMGWLIWKKQKIGLLHDYHYNHVQQKDKKAFCALNGIAMLLISGGFAAMDTMDLLWRAVYCVLFEAGSMAVACLSINIVAALRFDAKGNERKKKRK